MRGIQDHLLVWFLFPRILTSVSLCPVSPEEEAEFRAASLERELADYQAVLTSPLGYPRIASILNNIGAVYFERQNYDLALDYFAQSLRLIPHYVQPLFNRAIVLITFSILLTPFSGLERPR